MKRIFLTAAVTLGLGATAALADGKVYITLPDMSGIAQDPVAADRLLSDMQNTLVLSQNCPEASLSDEEHSLLTDGFDLLAYGELKLDTDGIIAKYETPAFDLLDNSTLACSEEPELKARTIATLIEAGGDLTPLPDQEKAYLDWRALMDQIRP
ncbi:hypothetical protein [Paracoccus sp. IB05]|uniref:hypothetical protein n=1 Tax=Paracoccus sp. IB05 TaxID=2779367 RepID=UPI0018E8DD98|nr:hypothetical protein [Paracoccus sp. IB05]MBJ2151289.1 hypothetical protein [Paracoccus sp. IB05]